MIFLVYVQASPVCWGVQSPNYLRQSLCTLRECSQADSGSRRSPQWPSQNPVAGSTPAGVKATWTVRAQFERYFCCFAPATLL